MFLHRKRNVPYNWSHIWQLPQSNFKCLIPFIVFFQQCFKNKACKKGKKRYSWRVLFLSHCKTGAIITLQDRCLSYASQKSIKSHSIHHLLAQLVDHQTTAQKIVGSNPSQTNRHGLQTTEDKVLPLYLASANSQTFQSSRMRVINHRLRLTALLWNGKEPTHYSKRVRPAVPSITVRHSLSLEAPVNYTCNLVTTVMVAMCTE